LIRKLLIKETKYYQIKKTLIKGKQTDWVIYFGYYLHHKKSIVFGVQLKFYSKTFEVLYHVEILNYF